jgi:hypothetical protein
MLVVLAAGEAQEGVPEFGNIVQYVAAKVVGVITVVVLKFAIFPALFSANQIALRGKSEITPVGPAVFVVMRVSLYDDIPVPPVSFPRIEILLPAGAEKIID